MQFQRFRRGPPQSHVCRGNVTKMCTELSEFHLFNGVSISPWFCYFRRKFTRLAIMSNALCKEKRKRERGIIAKGTRLSSPALPYPEHSTASRVRGTFRTIHRFYRRHRVLRLHSKRTERLMMHPLRVQRQSPLFELLRAPALDPECSRHVHSLRSKHVRPTTTTTVTLSWLAAETDDSEYFVRHPGVLGSPVARSKHIFRTASLGIPDLNFDDRFFEFV